MVVINIVFFIVSCIVLVYSGSWLVKSLTKIAAFLKLNEFLVAFILMAFATSVPELFVAITAGLAKNTALSLGNVIGANIADLTLVIGIAIILAKGIKIKSKKIKHDAMWIVPVVALPLVLMLIGKSISRIDGAILIAVFVFYTYRLIKKRKYFKRPLADGISRKSIVLSAFIFIIALVALFFGAKYVVHFATLLAVDFMLPQILIGLFLITIGTILPELVFESKAALMGHPEMALGDVMGTVVVNATLVLGVAALIFPITANFLLFLTSGIFMIVITFLFATFVESGSKLYWKEGVSLILFYVFFVILQFFVLGAVH